ncbi:LLM class F420-dependent oxidoreductase [Nostocoides sp.]|uniref:LLM class F420-dependent oxidoreductase n=1 Tax=Nostocoides sp. TaxID=1917966 RepID=UPI002B9F6810|nr:LLM class F420-dependent oxidoreductase [Tetrasphaera sp.]
MELRVFVEPQQGATYADQLAVARRAEECGYAAFFRSDHWLAMGGSGLPGPTDSWLTLAALARETTSIRLGTLVTSATFRHPGVLAISVAQVDQMSGGRVDFGLGAGWFEGEHTAYGLPFPGLGERFERLEEQLEIITGLWGTGDGESYSFAGRHYRLTDAPALPKPATPNGPPIVIGGKGRTRTPRLAARFADEFNVPFAALDEVAALYARLDAACDVSGRDPSEIVRSTALVLCCGANQVEVARRAGAIGREVGELKEHGVAGTPDECIETLREYAALGATRVYLQVLDLADLDHLDLVAERVAPHLS